MGKPSQNYGVPPKYGAHIILLAARHKRAHPACRQRPVLNLPTLGVRVPGCQKLQMTA